MQELGFIHFEGTQGNRVLIVNSIASHTTNRNICIEEMDITSFFSVYRSLQSFIFMRIQHNKNFLQHLLQSRHSPKTPNEFKKAKKKVKNLVAQGKLKSVNTKFKEYGISLERIAKEIGCCIRTAQKVLKYASGKGWIEKQHHYEWFDAPYVNFMPVEGYTFSTKHKLCIVHPNTYQLSASVSLALSF